VGGQPLYRGLGFRRVVLNHYHKGSFQTPDLMPIKKWLKTFFLASDPQVRICLIRTILAEILRERKIRLFFEDWEKDPDLHKAMQSALAETSIRA